MPNKLSRRSALAISVAAAAAGGGVATAAPTANPDAELIGLGKELETLNTRDDELRSRLAPLWEEHGDLMKAFEKDHGGLREFYREHGPKAGDTLLLARDAEIRRQLGAEYVALEEEHEETVAAMDAPARRMFALPAHTIEGLAVKARAAANENQNLWEEPFDDLGWPEKFIRTLIESVLAMAGEPVPGAAA